MVHLFNANLVHLTLQINNARLKMMRVVDRLPLTKTSQSRAQILLILFFHGRNINSYALCHSLAMLGMFVLVDRYAQSGSNTLEFLLSRPSLGLHSHEMLSW